MDIDKLKAFIQIAKDEGVSELEYKNDDEKLFVSFAKNTQVVSAPLELPRVSSASSSPDHGKSNNSSAIDDGTIEVTSPFVGTFYRSASPEAEAFAKVGQRVSAGSTLCIVEAMKIMNEIEADQGGEIVEVCVENETYVEFGQTLFRIRP